MAKAKFFLKEAQIKVDPKLKKETLIFLVYNHGGKRFKYSTEEHIHPDAWDFKEKEPIDSVKFPDNSNIYRRLEEYRFFLVDQVGELKRKNEEITPNKLKALFDREFKTKGLEDIQEDEKEDLLSFVNRYIKECESGKRKKPDKGRYESSTIKAYKNTINHLKDYCSDREVKLNFNDITLDLYSKLLDYFWELGQASNTIGNFIKNLKVFMGAAFNEDLHTCLDYSKKAFKKPSEETDSIYLTESELDRIYNLDLSGNMRLEKVRDLFIVGARTALRFSDLTGLKENNFYKNKNTYFVKVKRTLKTGVDVAVPLTKDAIEIIKKYDRKLPRNISNQKMNDYLKEIGELAGLNKVETKIITKGGERTEESYKRYELITSHTARRSAATNLFLAGFPAISIMKITGHKTESIFMKYIRMSAEDNANKMAKNDYFYNDFNEDDFSDW